MFKVPPLIRSRMSNAKLPARITCITLEHKEFIGKIEGGKVREEEAEVEESKHGRMVERSIKNAGPAQSYSL